jgi:hypothetical protein
MTIEKGAITQSVRRIATRQRSDFLLTLTLTHINKFCFYSKKFADIAY